MRSMVINSSGGNRRRKFEVAKNVLSTSRLVSAQRPNLDSICTIFEFVPFGPHRQINAINREDVGR